MKKFISLVVVTTGVTALAAGIQVADKKAFFGFTKGRILSLDYRSVPGGAEQPR